MVHALGTNLFDHAHVNAILRGKPGTKRCHACKNHHDLLHGRILPLETRRSTRRQAIRYAAGMRRDRLGAGLLLASGAWAAWNGAMYAVRPETAARGESAWIAFAIILIA